jgi:hypothetical protein
MSMILSVSILHIQGHAAGTWPYCTHMGHAVCRCQCCMALSMLHAIFLSVLHVHVHIAFLCLCCISVSVLHFRVCAACPCLCCMFMSVPHVHIRAEFPCTCSCCATKKKNRNKNRVAEVPYSVEGPQLQFLTFKFCELLKKIAIADIQLQSNISLERKLQSAIKNSHFRMCSCRATNVVKSCRYKVAEFFPSDAGNMMAYTEKSCTCSPLFYSGR